MIEVEILVNINNNLDEARTALSIYNYSYSEEIIDNYFCAKDSNRFNLNESGKLNECLRIREILNQKKYFFTYKNDVYENGKWIYSDEFETEISDDLAIKNILNHLGYIPLIKVVNKKYIYKFNSYKIILEDVQNLGIFLEIELNKNIDASDVDIEKNKIRQLLKSIPLNIGEEMNSGKPELLLIKHNNYTHHI